MTASTLFLILSFVALALAYISLLRLNGLALWGWFAAFTALMLAAKAWGVPA